MSAHRYVEENSSDAMLFAKRCNVGHQQVGRCCTINESQGKGNIYLCQAQIRLPTLALKPRGNFTRNPKQAC